MKGWWSYTSVSHKPWVLTKVPQGKADACCDHIRVAIALTKRRGKSTSKHRRFLSSAAPQKLKRVPWLDDQVSLLQTKIEISL